MQTSITRKAYTYTIDWWIEFVGRIVSYKLSNDVTCEENIKIAKQKLDELLKIRISLSKFKCTKNMDYDANRISEKLIPFITKQIKSKVNPVSSKYHTKLAKAVKPIIISYFENMCDCEYNEVKTKKCDSIDLDWRLLISDILGHLSKQYDIIDIDNIKLLLPDKCKTVEYSISYITGSISGMLVVSKFINY